MNDEEWRALTSTDDVELQRKALKGSASHRWLLAHNHSLDKKVLAKLSADASPLVVGTLYHNPSLTDEERSAIVFRDSSFANRMAADTGMPAHYATIKSIFET